MENNTQQTPTLIINFSQFYDSKWKEGWSIERIANEWAKLHVKAALEKAAEGAKWKSVPPRMTNMDGIEIDKDSILNAYPLDKIK